MREDSSSIDHLVVRRSFTWTNEEWICFGWIILDEWCSWACRFCPSLLPLCFWSLREIFSCFAELAEEDCILWRGNGAVFIFDVLVVFVFFLYFREGIRARVKRQAPCRGEGSCRWWCRSFGSTAASTRLRPLSPGTTISIHLHEMRIARFVFLSFEGIQLIILDFVNCCATLRIWCRI